MAPSYPHTHTNRPPSAIRRQLPLVIDLCGPFLIPFCGVCLPLPSWHKRTQVLMVCNPGEPGSLGCSDRQRRSTRILRKILSPLGSC